MSRVGEGELRRGAKRAGRRADNRSKMGAGIAPFRRFESRFDAWKPEPRGPPRRSSREKRRRGTRNAPRERERDEAEAREMLALALQVVSKKSAPAFRVAGNSSGRAFVLFLARLRGSGSFSTDRKRNRGRGAGGTRRKGERNDADSDAGVVAINAQRQRKSLSLTCPVTPVMSATLRLFPASS